MKSILLLSVLGLAVGCGTDVNYTRTLASEEETEQTKKDNRAIKIAGVTAGVALAGCVIVGVVKKKCISFAKKVAKKAEDVTNPKSVDSSKKNATEPAGVSSPKSEEVSEASSEVKDAFAVFMKKLETTPPSSGEPKDLGQMIKAMEDAGIPVSGETFENLRKNLEDGSVLIPQPQLVAFFTVGGDVLTEEKMIALRSAYSKGFDIIRGHHAKFRGRAVEIAREVNVNHSGFPDKEHYHFAIHQLVDEGIFTDEIAKKVKTVHFGEWQPVTEIFKRKTAPKPSAVSGVKPKQGDGIDLEDTQKTAKASEVKEQEVQTTAESSSSSAKPKQGDEPDLDNVQKEAKDSEVKEQEVQATAESSSSSTKPKQDDEPDLSDTQKTAKKSEGDEVKSSASSESSPVRKSLSEHLEDAGVSSASFDTLQKNMEDGSVIIPQNQLSSLIRAAGDMLTDEKADALRSAHYKGYKLVEDHYSKALGRANLISDGRPLEKGDFFIAIQQLVDEGIFTDEIAKKVNVWWSGDWVPVTEVFK